MTQFKSQKSCGNCELYLPFLTSLSANLFRKLGAMLILNRGSGGDRVTGGVSGSWVLLFIVQLKLWFGLLFITRILDRRDSPTVLFTSS